MPISLFGRLSFNARREALHPGLSPELFKNVFAQVASSVAVISFYIGRHLHGFTATSLTPVSLSPPLALFCAGQKNESHKHLAVGTGVGISILAGDQTELSVRFAGKAARGGYDDVPFFETQPGVPLLEGAIAVASGTIIRVLPTGDHIMFICRLQTCSLSTDGEPLLYFRRHYHKLGKRLLDRTADSNAPKQSIAL